MLFRSSVCLPLCPSPPVSLPLAPRLPSTSLSDVVVVYLLAHVTPVLHSYTYTRGHTRWFRTHAPSGPLHISSVDSVPDPRMARVRGPARLRAAGPLVHAASLTSPAPFPLTTRLPDPLSPLFRVVSPTLCDCCCTCTYLVSACARSRRASPASKAIDVSLRSSACDWRLASYLTPVKRGWCCCPVPRTCSSARMTRRVTITCWVTYEGAGLRECFSRLSLSPKTKSMEPFRRFAMCSSLRRSIYASI